MVKSTKIISIHYGHNASVAYLQNGEIKFCVSEERFNRIKNSTGFPKKALEFILHNSQGDFENFIKKYSIKIFKKNFFKKICTIIESL